MLTCHRLSDDGYPVFVTLRRAPALALRKLRSGPRLIQLGRSALPARRAVFAHLAASFRQPDAQQKLIAFTMLGRHQATFDEVIRQRGIAWL